MQADQIADVENYFLRTPKVSIKLRSVAVVAPTHSPREPELHSEHGMPTSGSNLRIISTGTSETHKRDGFLGDCGLIASNGASAR
jgi:hypothetical protein